jgi:hypothetical protein
MAVTIGDLASLCVAGGLRHHVDAEEETIRVVFVTRDYVNARGERLAILRIEAVAGGTRCRVVLERAFATGRRAAAIYLAACDATRDVPLIRLEHDATSRSLRLVAEMPVEDGTVTARQLFALVDHVIEAAEAAYSMTLAARGGGSKPSPREAA